ncbi:MAG: hypothetical protein OEU36_14760, partial [Gammaproteobacteria bacterium]|nr:hypothetical protein [Gammaproteobacteria bacterium]
MSENLARPTLSRSPARRMSQIEPFHVLAVLEQARAMEQEGRSVIHMEVGEPDFATADQIVAAGIRALQDGCAGYSQALGIPELRRAIA